MVGVPGKSQGCNTCRRRKVKCDLVRPGCGRCERAKLDCEGYEKFPVFINRTESGVQKRRRLEEVKPLTVVKKLKSESPTSTAFSSPKDVSVIPRFSNSRADEIGLRGWFFEPFVRIARTNGQIRSPTHWLVYVLDLATPTPALHDILLGVSMTRFGKENNNPVILTEGRRLYTKSLHLLQQSLNDPELSLHEDTLATTGLMILYELYDSLNGKYDGYMNHLNGLARLLQHRGPKRHQTERSLALLEHCRFLIMMRSLFNRKSTSLTTSTWMTDPWLNSPKSVEQKVFDHGLQLANLFECHDTLKNTSQNSPNYTSEALSVLTSCSALQDSLRQLHDELQASAPASIPIDTPESSHDSSPNPKRPIDPISPTAVVAAGLAGPYDDHVELLLAITALAIQLGLCTTGWDTYVLYTSSNSEAHDQSESDYADTIAFPLQLKRPLLARRIVRLVALYLALKEGKMGVARLMFALRYARTALEPGDEALDRCEALMEMMGGTSWQLGALMNPAKEPK